MSWPRIVALRHDDAGMLDGWLRTLGADDVQRTGDLALATVGEDLIETDDGRAVGALRGLLFDDLEIEAWLAERGHQVKGAGHGRLAVDMIARFGPVGLSRLRMQGVVACLARGQGMVGLAGDAMGVGSLYLCRLAGGEVVASDLDLLNRLDGGDRGPASASDAPPLWAGAATDRADTWRIPAGQVLMLGRGGLRFERLQRTEDALPWLRHRPEWMTSADSVTARRWLQESLTAALAAVERGVGPVMTMPPRDRWQEAMVGLASCPMDGKLDGDTAVWSLTGVAGLWGHDRWPERAPEGPPVKRLDWLRAGRQEAMTEAPVGCHGELPEPTSRLSEEAAAKIWLRHCWTIGQEIAAEQASAIQRAELRVWPHFDPAIVAGLGALGAAAAAAMDDRPA